MLPTAMLLSGEPRPLAPVDPAKLLAVLPKCPEEWNLLRSEARTLVTTHPESHAIRVYEEFVPPERRPEIKAETVVMTIRDTGRRGPQLEPFRKENLPKPGEPGSGDADVRILGNWGKFPLILVKLEGGRNALRVLVRERFVIELSFRGSNLRPAAGWFNTCDLAGLLSAPDALVETDSRVVVEEFIDELHPEKNRRYVRPMANDENRE